jgi:predicted RNase H-like HicB family nuclease
MDSMRLRVELGTDDTPGRWWFAVPALGVVGGGDSRDDALRRAREAILFTLEGDDQDVDPSADAAHFDVVVDLPSSAA